MRTEYVCSFFKLKAIFLFRFFYFDFFILICICFTALRLINIHTGTFIYPRIQTYIWSACNIKFNINKKNRKIKKKETKDICSPQYFYALFTIIPCNQATIIVKIALLLFDDWPKSEYMNLTKPKKRYE